MKLKFITEVDKKILEGKKIFCRVDFNVPLDEKGLIQDATRLQASLPLLHFLLNANVQTIILCSHLGRPKGKFQKSMSLAPVGEYLAKALNIEVVLSESCLDRGVKALSDQKKVKIILLENIRFHEEEEQGDSVFAKKLAELADFYVNDAFGTSHRKHASVYGIVSYFKGKVYAGPLIEKEINGLQKLLTSPRSPFVVMLGGSKVADKIKIIEKFLPKVSKILIGGAQAFAFLKAQGRNIGQSLCFDKDVKLAASLLQDRYSNKLVFPLDHQIAKHNPDQLNHLIKSSQVSQGPDIPDDYQGLDIGPKTISFYQNFLEGAKTVFWNGPMGFFENPHFAKGTNELAQFLAKRPLLDCYKVIGGGDSLRAITSLKLENSFSHLSTGGGASLEYLENGHLPAIDALIQGGFL